MKPRWLWGAGLALALAAAALFMLGNTATPYLQKPHGSIAILWDSRVAASAPVDPGAPAMAGSVSRFAQQLRVLDLAGGDAVGGPSALWVHPSAVQNMSPELARALQVRIRAGLPVVLMGSDPSALYSVLGVPPLEIRDFRGNTTLVGVGFRFSGLGADLPDYVVIGTPTDLIQAEGMTRAVTALIGGTNQLLR